MPAQSRTFRKSFRWREVDGAPLAAVTVLNGRGWIFCCPLCGCIHEVSGGQLDGRYAPNCLLRQLAQQAAPVGRPAEYGANWARVLQMWQDIHPAAAHNTVLLMSAQDIEALDQAQQAAERKAAARAKRGRPRKDKAA